MVGGRAYLLLSLLGISLALLNLRRVSRAQRRNLVLVRLAGALQLGAIVAGVTLAWPRNVIPLLPFVCLWAACALRVPDRKTSLTSHPWDPSNVLAYSQVPVS